MPFYVDAGENVWLGIKGHLNAVTAAAAAPVIAKYTGVLAAADIEEFTTTTMFPDHAVTSPRQRAKRAGSPVRSWGGAGAGGMLARHHRPPATAG